MTAALRRNSIFIGTDTATNEKVYLNLKWLQENNLHVIGPPGAGKTRLLLHLFQCLSRIPRATVVLMNPKGALARQARDWCLANGLTKRLVWFDPADNRIGYNPLLPNGAPIAAHTKSVREAIRSAWGQANFDSTPQLSRLLFLSIGVCRAGNLDITHAVQLLRSGSHGAAFRRKLLVSLNSQPEQTFLRESLAWFNALPERRQDELAQSSLARLEAFVADPAITTMLTRPFSLDVGDVITNHKILVVNMEIKRPLPIDDVRLWGRLLSNDIMSHVFASPSRVFFISDEAHLFLTNDFAQAIDMGRETGLHVVLAHQNLDQLRQEDESGRIYGSVMKCARIKAIFGDLASEDLDVLLPDAMIDGYDSMKVKDELTSLELDPIETSRLVFSVSAAKGCAVGETHARSHGKSHSTFESQGTTVGVGSATSSGHSSGEFAGVSAGEMILANGDVTMGTHESFGTTSGDFTSESSIDSESWSNASGVQDTVSESEATGTNSTTNSGTTMSCAKVPFYEYKKRRNISSRTFETEQEYLTKCLQKAKAQPVAHFILKLPKRAALFLRAPFVRDPQITDRRRATNLERVYAQPCYERRDAAALIDAPAPYHPENRMLEFPDPPDDFRE